MSGSAEIFLGVIALATLTTAIVQIAILVTAGKLTRRLERLVHQVERELQPIFGHLNSIGRDASQAVSVAAAQIERADRLVSDLARRLDQTLATVQTAVVAPAREGAAIVSALRAMFAAVRKARGRSTRAEEEDALFI